MPVYSVEVICHISKVYNIKAPDEDKAAELAHQLFTVEPEDHEAYNQETGMSEEIDDNVPLDAEWEE